MSSAPRSPRPRPRKSSSAEEVGDETADLVAGVLLQEVAGPGDRPRRRPPELGRERLALRERQRAVLRAPQQEHLARVVAQRLERAARARGLLELEHERRER